jgi:quercetin dioxygenase-like cupin family protein
MLTYHLLATGIDTSRLMLDLSMSPQLWNENRLRKEYPNSPHAQVDDIWLRFQSVDGNVIDEHECIEYAAWHKLHSARHMVHTLLRQVEGVRVGRVVITRLPPGGTIARHADGGSPAEYYERFQIALNARPGVTFCVGDGAFEQRTGDIHWFNNQLEHEVVNNSDDDRVVMIVDIRCAK